VFADKNPVICQIGGKERKLKPNEITFFKPNEPHVVKADGKSSPSIIVVSFECKSEAMQFFDDKIIKVNASTVKFLYQIVSESKRTFDIPVSNPETKKLPLKEKPTLGGLQLIRNFLELFLVNLLRDETEWEGENNIFITTSHAGELSEKILSLLNENIYDRLKIEDLAEQLNYSKSSLFKVFKKQTGMTISAYFAMLKINKAKELLISTDLSVTEISEKLSFDTQSYFTKSFKRATGSSPLHFRKLFKAH
jgi:AraC-like DNA-binding protein